MKSQGLQDSIQFTGGAFSSLSWKVFSSAPETIETAATQTPESEGPTARSALWTSII